jgi:hypothetical protein
MYRLSEVVSSGIEPESRASETLILSIVLRDRWEVASRQSPVNSRNTGVVSFESTAGNRSEGLRLTACIF